MPSASNRLSRRQAITGGLAGVAGVAAFGARPAVEPDAVARRVILAVADGISAGTLSLARLHSQSVLGRDTHWSRLLQSPGARRSLCTTSSANSLVTDSAAASSAWSIGQKVDNGALCIDPEGRPHEPVLVTAGRAGFATGLVTTTRVTHATPAGFIANVPRRDMEGIIAEQMIERPVDVILGGGGRHFPEPLRSTPGVRTVSNATELERLRNERSEARWLGLFNDTHLPYVLDRAPTIPSLTQMSRAALERLDQTDRGFVLQVEGGRVDHAAHANDAPSLIREQIDFDDALGALIDYTLSRDDTLLIATTDHGNANPGLTLYGSRGRTGIERIAAARHSFAWIEAELASVDEPFSNATRLREIIEAATSIALDDSEIDILRRSQTERVDPFKPANKLTSVLGSLLANYFGIAFVSPNHTADDVEVTAIGPGSEAIAPMMDNTELRRLLLGSIGVESVPA